MHAFTRGYLLSPVAPVLEPVANDEGVSTITPDSPPTEPYVFVLILIYLDILTYQLNRHHVVS